MRAKCTSSSPSRTWTLDPVDGTLGFLRGDQYAVCLALMDHNHQIVLGVLGCPRLSFDMKDNLSPQGCLIYSVKGHGAFQVIFHILLFIVLS
jgi:3'(2'), 5'-bisphosphate nucleotidase